MQLRTVAEIATIIGVAVAVLGYMKIEPNALDKIPEIHQKKVESDLKTSVLTIDEKANLYIPYKAALAIESSYSRDNALSKVINSAINSSDFKLAVLAGKEIDSTYTKSRELAKIVDAALMKKEYVGYAVIAAELIPSSYSKDTALSKIISFYENGETNITSSKNLTELDKYKKIFTFADSTAGMGMSENDAKIFTDNWIKQRTYKDFLYFKKVFIFANSSANMGMSEESAKLFAMKWIDQYTENEFDIFKTAFGFADSSAGMSLSAEDAEKFAFKKILEYRESANKTVEPIKNPQAAF